MSALQMFIAQNDDRHVNMRDIPLHDKCDNQGISEMQERLEYKESVSLSGEMGTGYKKLVEGNLASAIDN